MDKILEKHLANALVLVKSDLNISIPDENIIPYESCVLENNQYKISTEFDKFTSDIVGYWKDKPIISYNRTKYAILENSSTIVKLKSLNVTDDKIKKEPEEIKNIIPLFPNKNLVEKPVKKVLPKPITPKIEPVVATLPKPELEVKPEPNPEVVAQQLKEILPKKEDEKNSVISSYVDTLKKTDQQTKELPDTEKYDTTEYIQTDKPKTIEEELFALLDSKKDDPRLKRLFNHYNEQTKKEVHEINEKYSKQYFAKILETSGGGGTSNSAVDFKGGGVIDGDLTINANLSVLGDIFFASPSKKVFIIGNTVDTDYVINHNFNTKDLIISLYNSDDEMVFASIKNINSNQTLVSFGSPVFNIKVVIVNSGMGSGSFSGGVSGTNNNTFTTIISTVPAPTTAQINVVIDNGTDIIPDGSFVTVQVPSNIVITNWSLISNMNTTTYVDVLCSNYASYPIFNKISPVSPTESNYPKLVATNKGPSTPFTSLSGWKTSISADSILKFYVNSNDNANYLMISLKCTKT